MYRLINAAKNFLTNRTNENSNVLEGELKILDSGKMFSYIVYSSFGSHDDNYIVAEKVFLNPRNAIKLKLDLIAIYKLQSESRPKPPLDYDSLTKKEVNSLSRKDWDEYLDWEKKIENIEDYNFSFVKKITIEY